MGNLRITVLVENTASAERLIAEHGLSVWIESGDGHFLFDTGQGPALGPNADSLGIPLHGPRRGGPPVPGVPGQVFPFLRRNGPGLERMT